MNVIADGKRIFTGDIIKVVRLMDDFLGGGEQRTQEKSEETSPSALTFVIFLIQNHSNVNSYRVFMLS